VIRTSFRLPIATLRRIDTIAATLRKRQVGNVTRADVVRMLIASGLDRAERKLHQRARQAKPRK
jgi:hypothetical protein